MKRKFCSAAFFDIDGTLFDHKSGCIPPLHMKALEELQEQGIKVCLCTARALPLIEELGILHAFAWDGIVAGIGSYLYGKDLQIIEEDCFDSKTIQQLNAIAKKENTPLFVSGNTIFSTDMNPYTERVLIENHVFDCPVRDFEESDHPCVISFMLDNPEIHRKELEAIENIHCIYARASIDVVKEGLSKYKGLQKMMKHFGFEPSDYIAFGDGASDLEMLQHALLAAAMEDSDDTLYHAFPVHCPSAHKAGIYTFLKEKGVI